MSAGKRARAHGGGRGWTGFLLFLAVMAAVVLAIPFAGPWVYQLVWESGSDTVSESVDSSTPTLEGSASPTAAQDGTETDSAEPSDTDDGSGDAVDPIRQCAAELAEVEVAVDAAQRGVDHWRTHVQARTDMLAGQITEVRMEAIYERTRARGHADGERFSAAVSELPSQILCQDLKALPEGSIDSPERECLVRSQRAEAALSAAQSTMDEWLTHVHHMEQYDDGGMRTGTALKLWIRAWRKAPEGISAYEESAADLAAAPACSAA